MLHIVQNDLEVPPGNLLDHLAIPYVVLHPYRGDKLAPVDSISALIVLGGAMGANDDQRHPFLSDLKQLIRTVVAARIPYLGICLGGQLLAAALGASVVSQRWEELGTMNIKLTEGGKADRLFAGIPEEFSTFQWHHDSFDIPDAGELLASSAACPNQAFRVGEAAWGLQFHPEVTEQIIRGWCAWDSSTEEKSEQLIEHFSIVTEKYRATSRLIMNNFLQIYSQFILSRQP
jgi:GMP synthase-like glutamine amidotransferase